MPDRSANSASHRGRFPLAFLLVCCLLLAFGLHVWAAGKDIPDAVTATVRLLMFDDSVKREEFASQGQLALWTYYRWLRILIPVLASLGLILAYFRLLGSNGNWLLARLWPADVVVLGDGAVARQLVLSHAGRHERLAWLSAALAQLPHRHELAGCRLFGGDPACPDNLRWLAIWRARAIYVVGRDDDQALATLAAVNAVLNGISASRRRSAQVCLVHLESALLGAQLTQRRYPGIAQLRVFNVWKNAARRLITQHGPHLHAPPDGQPHALVLGSHRLSEALIEQFARLGHYPDEQNVRVSLVAPDATRFQAGLYSRFPALDPQASRGMLGGENESLPLIDTNFIDAPVDGLSLAQLAGMPPVSVAYVCCAAQDEAVRALENLLLVQPAARFPIVCCLLEDASEGLAELLAGPRSSAFPVLRQALALGPDEPRLDEFDEREAALVNLMFRQAFVPRGGEVAPARDLLALAANLRQPEAGEAPADGPWAELFREWLAIEEWERESSRDAVRHLETKWHYFRDLDGRLDATALDRLGRLEHRRWCAERLLSGWRLQAQTDKALRRHACLLPYDKLPLSERCKDRLIVQVSELIFTARRSALKP